MRSGFGDLFAATRQSNDAALAAFGLDSESYSQGYSCILPGAGPTVFTIGYERRDGDELLARLRDVGVETLVDVRERPFSRKVDFRSTRLQERCKRAGIAYLHDAGLGSTTAQRDTLKASGDIDSFMKTFRAYASKRLDQQISDLCELAEEECIAMLCYERCHHECHRSVLAEHLNERIDANIIAIV